LQDNKFKITLKSNTTRTFFLPIIEFEDRDQKVPELNFAVNITTNKVVPTVTATTIAKALGGTLNGRNR
jgi:hypothetical protein